MHSLLSAVVFALCTLTAVPGAIAFLIAGTLVLTATCQSVGVGTTTAAIDLDSCISNSNGGLIPGSGFSSSCRDIGFSGVELSAQCKDPSGTFVNTQINLNVIFSNVNGLITCPLASRTITGTPTQLGGQGGSPTPGPPGGGGGTALPALDDCVSAATCSFNPTSTGSTYPQQTQIGGAFDNCDSSIAVHNTFSGSVTVTDNWSVDVGVSLGIPKLLGVDVQTTVEHGKEVTMSQTIDYTVPPQLQAALVGTASFNAIFGSMNMDYGSHSSILNDVVYFQSTSNQPEVGMRTIGCGQSWPIWNATAVDKPSPASNLRALWGYSLATGVVIMALLLVTSLLAMKQQCGEHVAAGRPKGSALSTGFAFTFARDASRTLDNNVEDLTERGCGHSGSQRLSLYVPTITPLRGSTTLFDVVDE
ncbi:hypothetical protein B0H19DRAFT_1333024 [Mycena capillaripes]|nr:hypothetical protein B0H19DRAFT_1333024 [Mycena capillaripes]